jgi:hypothetical protein
MPDPTRPVTGAPIESEWGGAVHDAVFTPRGVRVAGGASTAVGTTLEQLQLNTAVDDPGGWLASDSITLPSGSDGLYTVFLDAQTDNGSVGERTRVQLRVNGAGVQTFFIDNNGTTAETDARSFLVPLSAGDVVNVYAGKTGGTDPDVLVRALAIIRIGSELGA